MGALLGKGNLSMILGSFLFFARGWGRTRPVWRAVFGIACMVVVASAHAQPPQAVEIRLDTPEATLETVGALREQAEAEKRDSAALATRLRMPVSGETHDGRFFELMRLDDGRPVYYITTNVNAAISTAANLVRNTSPFNVDGTGIVVGIWDAGSVLSTHQEFGGRVTVKDGASSHYHATHVGGTIGASGVDANALGMAPASAIDSYDWNSDFSEASGRAMVTPGQAGTIQISNHSYGIVAGWIYASYSGTTGWHWMGVYGEREDRNFGRYSSTAQTIDSILYNAPYYLPIKSAGNDRSNAAPAQGTLFFYYNGAWLSKAYDAATDPYGDGYDNGGFDTISDAGVAKNLLTVGAAYDAVSGGVRYLPNGTITDFSGWGPTDDGRVKPDVVGNGYSLYSTDNLSNTAYTSLSGTSMSSPNVTGSAALLLELFGNLFPGEYMLASTLKGLLIHTADDMGNAGPDYAYGWGYVNTEAAADHIRDQAMEPASYRMVEGTLDGGNPSDGYGFAWDGVSPIRATLCWTDPAGATQTGLDVTTPVLVNDLDLRILGPGGTPTYFPFRLDRANPSNPATTGDNTIDNVEQVLIASPGTPGTYTVQVSHKGVLTNSTQTYSLLISGIASSSFSVSPSQLSYSGPQGGPFTPGTQAFTVQNNTAGTVNWIASATGSWHNLSSSGGTLNSGQQLDVSVPLDASTASLAPGTYQSTVSFTDTTNATQIDVTVELTVQGAVLPIPGSVATMNSDPGWSRDGLWEFGPPMGLGGVNYGSPDPTSGYSGVNVMGVNLNGDYGTVPGGPYYATMGPVNCSSFSNVMLRYMRWLNTDYQNFVFATIEVSTNGTTWTTVWGNGTTEIVENAWSLQEIDLSSYADGQSSVWVRWGYQIANLAFNYSGWNIDDVALVGEAMLPSFLLNSDPGWSMQGEWAYGVPLGQGGATHGYPDPTSGATGSSVLGVNLAGDYSLSVGGPWYLQTSAINCANFTNVELAFRRWLNTDIQPYVSATVDVSTNGSTWTEVWNNGTTAIEEDAWSTQNLDVSAIADGVSTLYVRWGYAIASDLAFPLSGWNIDDVAFGGTALTDWDGDGVSDIDELLSGANPYASDSDVRVTYNGPAGALPDLSSQQFAITVDGLGTVLPVLDVNVVVNITHTYDSDLFVELTSPNATNVVLIDHAGGAGDNFSNTRLDDEAATSIAVGTAPFAGSYIPADNLSAFDGAVAGGTWVLTVHDTVGGDSGTLNSWRLEILTLQPGTGNPVWVNFAAADGGNGTASLPLNTVADGLLGVAPAGTIRFVPGATGVTPRISDSVRLESTGGSVRIGVIGMP